MYIPGLSPRWAASTLVAVAVCLFIADMATNLAQRMLHHPLPFGLRAAFSLGSEMNVPTWYSSSMLLLCSLLVAIVATAKGRTDGAYVLHWGILSAVFLYLSMDEAAGLHERTVQPVRMALGSSEVVQLIGPLRLWVVPATAFLFSLSLGYLRFLRHLPSRTRVLLIAAAATYTVGAIGIEVVSGRVGRIYGSRSLHYALATALEEMLEMVGIVILVYTLLSYTLSLQGQIQEDSFPESNAHVVA